MKHLSWSFHCLHWRDARSSRQSTGLRTGYSHFLHLPKSSRNCCVLDTKSVLQDRCWRSNSRGLMFLQKLSSLWGPWIYLLPLEVTGEQSGGWGADPVVCGTSWFLHRQTSIYLGFGFCFAWKVPGRWPLCRESPKAAVMPPYKTSSKCITIAYCGTFSSSFKSHCK